LDWTSNPLVALFFATEDSQNTKDGVVSCVSRNKTNELLPDRFKEMIEAQQRYQLLYVYNLRCRFRSLKQFDIESKDGLVWIEAPSANPRIVNQYAFFSVMPGIDTSTSDWLANYPEVYWGVAVPSKLKYEMNNYRLTPVGSCS
jgi:hypothetical protein